MRMKSRLRIQALLSTYHHQFSMPPGIQAGIAARSAIDEENGIISDRLVRRLQACDRQADLGAAGIAAIFGDIEIGTLHLMAAGNVEPAGRLLQPRQIGGAGRGRRQDRQKPRRCGKDAHDCA